jgi:hypothetical protein
MRFAARYPNVRSQCARSSLGEVMKGQVGVDSGSSPITLDGGTPITEGMVTGGRPEEGARPSCIRRASAPLPAQHPAGERVDRLPLFGIGKYFEQTQQRQAPRRRRSSRLRTQCRQEGLRRAQTEHSGAVQLWSSPRWEQLRQTGIGMEW